MIDVATPICQALFQLVHLLCDIWNLDEPMGHGGFAKKSTANFSSASSLLDDPIGDSLFIPHAWLAMNIDEHDTVNDHVGISSRFAWFVWLVTAGGVKCRNSTCFHQSWWRCCRDVPCCLDSVAFMVGPWRPWSSKKLQQRAPVKIKWLGRFHSLHLFPPYQALLLVD